MEREEGSQCHSRHSKSSSSDFVGNQNSSNDERRLTRGPEQYIPMASTVRIMRSALPSNARIAEEAKETVQVCVAQFIGYITGEAKHHCHDERRRLITVEDLLFAIDKLGFKNYVDILNRYMNRYREAESGRILASQGQEVFSQHEALLTAMNNYYRNIGGARAGSSISGQGPTDFPGFDAAFGGSFFSGHGQVSLPENFSSGQVDLASFDPYNSGILPDGSLYSGQDDMPSSDPFASLPGFDSERAQFK